MSLTIPSQPIHLFHMHDKRMVVWPLIEGSGEGGLTHRSGEGAVGGNPAAGILVEGIPEGVVHRSKPAGVAEK
jgi:hypothetical protein